MKHFFAALAFALALPVFALDFWHRGLPTPPIVISQDALIPVQQAAEALRNALQEATSETWQITTEAPAAGAAFYLGEASGKNKAFTDALPHDGFWTKIDATGVRIAGHDYQGGSLGIFMHPMRDIEAWSDELKLCAFGDMGTWNGVHRFLETLGFRWYMPGKEGTVIPRLDAIDIAETEGVTSPAFEYRYAWLCNFKSDAKDALWYRQVGFGAPTPVNIIHSYWCLEEKPEILHDEFFALINGVRDKDNKGLCTRGVPSNMFCLSNEALIDAWTDFICEYFKEHPDQDLFPLCPPDSLIRICECEKCQSQLSPHLGKYGQFSNYVWTFADKVARKVNERMPGKRVGCFAYSFYCEVPDCLTELSPNLAVMICYIRQDFRDPAEKKRIRGLIEGWGNLAHGQLYFWTYQHKDYWLPWRGFPRFYPHLLAEDIRENHRLNAAGEFLETESRNWDEDIFEGYDFHWPALYHMTTYLSVKLLWNPEIDVDALLEEYYKLYYGPAALQAKAFWTLAEEATMTRNCEHPVRQFTKAEVSAMLEMLETGLALCPEGSVYRQRLQKLYDETEPYCRQLTNVSVERPNMRFNFSKEILPIDGTIWENAFKRDMASKIGTAINFKTQTLTAADPEGLAFTFVCYEEDMNTLRENTTQHDGNVWEDDSVEIHLSHLDNTNGIIIILSSSGVFYDASWKDMTTPDDVSWNPALITKVTKYDDKWIAQVKIPWSDLGITPDELSTLKGNLYRSHFQGRYVTYAAYATTMAHNHRTPDMFVPLELEKSGK